MKDLYNLTIKEASEKLHKGEITAIELTKSCLDRVKEKDSEINAFITVCGDLALESAKLIDERFKKGEKLGQLSGIPYSLKDVYLTKGLQTTAGANMLKGYIPQYNATLYKRLNDAGAILIGKTNCDSFGFGASTEHSAFGPTKNPFDLERVAGGSSGGSGAAVAYGGGLFSIAEDTGGSTRCPASCCGVVGIKPTYGRVSRYGSVAFASSFDSMGPITKTIEDSAIVLKCIAGKDPRDATSSENEVPDYEKQLSQSIKGKTIGIPTEYFGEGLDDEVRDSVEAAIEKFKKLGCKTKEISLPTSTYAVPNYYIIGTSEASSNLARYDGIRYGHSSKSEKWDTYIMNVRSEAFGEEEKRRILLGTYALSSGYADQYYKKAQGIRALLREDFEKAFKNVDVILTPTMPVLPFKLGERLDDPIQLWLIDAYTSAINPTGLPAISIPVQKEGQLPIGMQLIAPHFKEEVLYNFGHIFETS